jgi:hypothetical protein
VVLEEVAALVGGVAVRGFIVRGHGVDDVVVLAAPGGAGHVSGGGLDGLDGVSLGVEHHDAMAAEHGHPDVALAVHDHAVRLMGRVNEAAQHACVADVARLVVVVVRVDVLGARVVEVHGLLVRRPADAVAAHEAVRHLLDRPVRVVAPEAATRPAVVGGEVVAAVRQALDVDFRAPEAARGVHAPVVEAAHVALLLRDDLLQDLEPARLLVHERKALVVQADVRAGHVLAERHHRHAVLQVQHPQARLRPVRLRNRALGQLRASLDRLARLRVHRQNVQLRRVVDAVYVMERRVRRPVNRALPQNTRSIKNIERVASLNLINFLAHRRLMLIHLRPARYLSCPHHPASRISHASHLTNVPSPAKCSNPTPYSSISPGGTPPDPLGRLRRGLGSPVFCEAEQRFLLLFLEKEGYHQLIFLVNSFVELFSGGTPRPPGSASPRVG